MNHVRLSWALALAALPAAIEGPGVVPVAECWPLALFWVDRSRTPWRIGGAWRVSPGVHALAESMVSPH